MTMEMEEGGRDGGLEEGETESDLSGVLEPGGELILKCERSVGLFGAGNVIIMEVFMSSMYCIQT